MRRNFSIKTIPGILLNSLLFPSVSLLLSTPLAVAAPKSVPHFELEMPSTEYAKILSARKSVSSAHNVDADERKLKPVLALGQRNMEFLVFLNESRQPSERISLTSPETAPAAPIDKPKHYNAEIAYEAYEKLLQQMPTALREILAGDQAFPSKLPLPESEYILWGQRVDQVYQNAARWLTLKPYLSEYAKAKKTDIRGYYFLSREVDLFANLADWQAMPASLQAQYKEWLIGLCYNNRALSVCQRELERLIKANANIGPFYMKFARTSQKKYDSYFNLQWPRSDVTFLKSQPEVLRVPFIDPKNEAVLSYLRDNIEDEFKWQGWNLRLDFLPNGNEKTTAHIEWQAGVTPHVSDANTIVMDQNQPLTEYDSQWTIRHEYGHIIGFPDCYIEFYDSDKAVMTSYQLDITNLMCSRRGKLQQKHVDELKRVYLK